MFKCMRDGSFDPDLAAIDRVVQISDRAPTDQPMKPPANMSEFTVPSGSDFSGASECGEVEPDLPCQSLFEGPERIPPFS